MSSFGREYDDEEDYKPPLARRDRTVKQENPTSVPFKDVPRMTRVSLENGLAQYLTERRTDGGPGREAVYQGLRSNSIYRAKNRQGAARASLEAINEAYQVQEPIESRRFDTLATEARLWLLLRELSMRELRQFEAATSFRPAGRDVEDEGKVEALRKWVQEEVIAVITAQEDRNEEATGPGNAQYLREMCAAKAPFVLNNFYDHIGGINMRGRAQATGGFTSEELKQNNVLEMIYEEDGASYQIDPEVFPQAAQTLFSTLRRTG